jgi:hypothetical protein
VLRDLCESGIVLKLGSGTEVAYRAATTEELRDLRATSAGSDELVWLMVYREGPLSADDLARLVPLPDATLNRALADLLTRGSIQLLPDGRYSSRSIVIPLGAAQGWEAAIFDHFQATVKAMCARLREGADPSGNVGGSTYSFNVWPGHPLEEEVRSTLRTFRTRCSDLRRRVQAFNDQQGLPNQYEKIIAYAGQCGIEQDSSNDREAVKEESERDGKAS